MSEPPMFQPVTPPTEPGALGPRGGTSVSAWPGTIGTIAIVFGAMGALAGVAGLVLGLFLPDLLAGLESGAQANPNVTFQTEVSTTEPEFMAVSGAMTLALAVLLLMCGIGIIGRRAWSVGASKAWSWMKILFVVGHTYFGWTYTQAEVAEMDQAGMPDGLATGLAVMGACVGVVWGMALPVFLLIWFGRSKIKGEVAAWR